MRASAYRDLSIQELVDQVSGLRQSLFNLRVRNTTKELENSSRLRRERRELARALTVLNERRRTEKAARTEPQEPSAPQGEEK
jgi:large subunit ribosomal protein L29